MSYLHLGSLADRTEMEHFFGVSHLPGDNITRQSVEFIYALGKALHEAEKATFQEGEDLNSQEYQMTLDFLLELSEQCKTYTSRIPLVEYLKVYHPNISLEDDEERRLVSVSDGTERGYQVERLIRMIESTRIPSGRILRESLEDIQHLRVFERLSELPQGNPAVKRVGRI